MGGRARQLVEGPLLAQVARETGLPNAIAVSVLQLLLESAGSDPASARRSDFLRILPLLRDRLTFYLGAQQAGVRVAEITRVLLEPEEGPRDTFVDEKPSPAIQAAREENAPFPPRESRVHTMLPAAPEDDPDAEGDTQRHSRLILELRAMRRRLSHHHSAPPTSTDEWRSSGIVRRPKEDDLED